MTLVMEPEQLGFDGPRGPGEGLDAPAGVKRNSEFAVSPFASLTRRKVAMRRGSTEAGVKAPRSPAAATLRSRMVIEPGATAARADDRPMTHAEPASRPKPARAARCHPVSFP